MKYPHRNAGNEERSNPPGGRVAAAVLARVTKTPADIAAAKATAIRNVKGSIAATVDTIRQPPHAGPRQIDRRIRYSPLTYEHSSRRALSPAQGMGASLVPPIWFIEPPPSGIVRPGIACGAAMSITPRASRSAAVP